MTPITRILVPTDFSETSDAALAYAKGLAEVMGASLHLVHVFDDIFATSALTPEVYAQVPDDVRERTIRGIEARLDERLPEPYRARCQGTTEVRTGLIAPAIVECAQERDADVIVMGTHGRGGVAHVLLGSVAERVLRVAPCPVLTVCAAHLSSDIARTAAAVRPPEGSARLPRITRVLVPTDFSAQSDEALDYARTLAARFGASLHLLHVVEDAAASGGLIPEAYIGVSPEVRAHVVAEAQARLRHRLTERDREVLHARSEVICGVTADTIGDYADNLGIDLIVMGTHGRTGLAHVLIGSVAEKVVRTAPCPVFTVRERAPRVDGPPVRRVEAVPS